LLHFLLLNQKFKSYVILINEGSDDLDVETMIDDFMTFFLAGQETTANKLAFCFLEINKNPSVLEK
jgi:cholesterol 24(S)-hydroxylase